MTKIRSRAARIVVLLSLTSTAFGVAGAVVASPASACSAGNAASQPVLYLNLNSLLKPVVGGPCS